MKKALSFCFLSFLLTMACSVTRAQQQCCFWLQNMQPEEVNGITNISGSTLPLDWVLNRAEVGNTDVYEFRICDPESGCGFPAETRVSLEWELIRDGEIVNGTLSEYCDFRILSKYDRLGENNPWFGGIMPDGNGVYDPTAGTQDYPGVLPPLNEYLNFDYLYLDYFMHNLTKIEVTWKQVGDYKLTIRLRERTGGSDHPSSYWDAQQSKFVGGQGSMPTDRIIAENTIEYYNLQDHTDKSVSKEVCANGDFTYGDPAKTFDRTGDYYVVHGEEVCGHFVADYFDTLHFFVRERPKVRVNSNDLEMCVHYPDETMVTLRNEIRETPYNPENHDEYYPGFQMLLDSSLTLSGKLSGFECGDQYTGMAYTIPSNAAGNDNTVVKYGTYSAETITIKAGTYDIGVLSPDCNYPYAEPENEPKIRVVNPAASLKLDAFLFEPHKKYTFVIKKDNTGQPYVMCEAVQDMDDIYEADSIHRLTDDVHYDRPDAPGLTKKVLQFAYKKKDESWSNWIDSSRLASNFKFNVTPGLPGEDGRTYEYKVRQVNTYENFRDFYPNKVVCEGKEQIIKFTVYAYPGVPEQLKDTGYVCQDERDKLADMGLFKAYNSNCVLMWADNPELNGASKDLRVNASTPGVHTYYVYQIHKKSQCWTPDSSTGIPVRIYPLPDAKVTVDSSSSNSFCLGGSVTLKVTPGNYDNYKWMNPFGKTLADGKDTVITDTPTKPSHKSYSVEVTRKYMVDGNETKSCTKTFKSEKIDVNEIPGPPVISGDPAYEICNEKRLDESDTLETLTASAGRHGDNVRWYYRGDSVHTGTSYEVDLRGFYEPNYDKYITYQLISINEETGCETPIEDAVDYRINFYKTPELTLVPESGREICPGGELDVTADVVFSFDQKLVPEDREPYCDITIGKGMLTKCELPFCNYYKNSWNQMIYPQEQIGEAKTIRSIQFECQRVMPRKYQTLKIFLGHTDLAQVDTGDWVRNLTLVYENTDGKIGDSYGWEIFNFSTPFEYNGIDNLVVVVSVKSDKQMEPLVYSCSAGNSMSRYANEAGFDEEPDNTNPGHNITMYKFVPNIRICDQELTREDVYPESKFKYREVVVDEYGYGSGAAQLPVDNEVKYSYSQQIYDKSEIKGGAMKIRGIKLYYTGNDFMDEKSNVDIYLAHTDKWKFNDINDWIDIQNAVKVYSGALNCSRMNDWNAFTFDTPFDYNGTDNLVLIVDDNSANAAPSGIHNPSDHQFGVKKQSNNVTLRAHNNSMNINPASAPTVSWNAEISKFRNKIVFMGMQPEMPEQTVAAGTQGNTPDTKVPVAVDKKYSYTQQIYSGYDLADMRDVDTVIIRGIKFDYASDALNTESEVDIFLAATDKTAFDNENDWFDIKETEQVYRGKLNCTHKGYNEFTFDTPLKFMPNGSKPNLVLIVNDRSGAKDDASLGFNTAKKNNTVLYAGRNNKSYNPYNDVVPSGAQLGSARANVKFVVHKVTDADYCDFVWSGDIASSIHNTARFADLYSCDTTYKAEVTVTDHRGCKATDPYEVIVIDKIPIEVRPKTLITEVEGCSAGDSINAPAYTTVEEFLNDKNITTSFNVVDNCNNLKDITYEGITREADESKCPIEFDRRYKLTDSCGNEGFFTQTVRIKDEEAPTLLDNVPLVELQPVLDASNCTYLPPARETMLNALRDNFDPKDNCVDVNELLENAVFMVNSQNTDNARDIFRNTVPGGFVTVTAYVEDRCGKQSNIISAFKLTRPAAMTIVHNPTALPNEICLGDMVTLTFDTNWIENGTPGYTYWWESMVNDNCVLLNTDMVCEAKPNMSDTNYVFKLTVTDANNCKAEAITNNVYVNPLPSVYIDTVVYNGESFPICPNYGKLTLRANAQSNLISHPALTYFWQGDESIDQETGATTSLHILPELCTHTYLANVTVTSEKGCKASAHYEIPVADTEAPFYVLPDGGLVITVDREIEECKYLVPDVNAKLRADKAIKDNCDWGYELYEFRQVPAAGTEMTSDVVVTVYAKTPCCDREGSAEVKVILPPYAFRVNVTPEKDTICYGDDVNLTAAPVNNTGKIIYTWFNGHKDTVNGVSSATALKPAENIGGVHNDLYVQAVDEAGCKATGAPVLVVKPTPSATDFDYDIQPDTWCKNAGGNKDGMIVIHGASNKYEYKARDGEATWHAHNIETTYGPFAGGDTVYFEVKNELGCIGEFPLEVPYDTTHFTIPEISLFGNSFCDVHRYNGSIVVENPGLGYYYELVNVPNTRVRYDGIEAEVRYDSLVNGIYTLHMLTDRNCKYQRDNIEVKDLRVFPELFAQDTTYTPQGDCMSPDGALTLNAPVPGYEYVMNGETFTAPDNNPYTFDGLEMAHYDLSIISDKGCESKFGFDIPDGVAKPQLETTPNTVCAGNIGYNGKVTILDRDENFTYILGPDTLPAGENAFEGLVQNNYTMSYITDKQCVRTVDFVIEDGSTIVFPAYKSSLNTACETELANATIELTNPDADYVYKLINPNTLDSTNFVYGAVKNLRGDLAYVLWAMNLNTGCMDVSKLDPFGDEPLVLDFEAENVTTLPQSECAPVNGSITLTEDAECVYELFKVDPTGQIADTLAVPNTNLEHGTYILTKRHVATGCTTYDVLNVDDNIRYYKLHAHATPDANCTTEGTGTIVVDSVEEAGLDEFEFSADGVNYVSGNIIEHLDEGLYTLYARNMATGCVSESAGIDVSGEYKYPEILSKNSSANYSCKTIKTGTVTVSADMPCIFTLTRDSSIEMSNATAVEEYTFEGLDHGEYKVVATSELGCSHQDTSVTYVTVIDSTDSYVVWYHVDPDQYCDERGDGRLSIDSVTGFGKGDFEYALDGSEFVSTQVFTGLDAGYAHVLKARNNNTECIMTYDSVVILTNYKFPEITFVTSTANTYCNENKNGTVSVSIKNDSPKSLFELYDAGDVKVASTTNPAKKATFEDLASGDYHVVAISEYGCSDNSSMADITVEDKAFVPAFSLIVVPDGMCVPTAELPGTGKIAVEFADASINASTDYKYEYFKAIDTNARIYEPCVGHYVPIAHQMTQLDSGLYMVRVTNNITECSEEKFVVVTRKQSEPHFTVNLQGVSNCNGVDNGVITVNTTEGSTPEEWSHNLCKYSMDGTNWQESNEFTGLGLGEHTVYVMSNMTGCVNTFKSTIETSDAGKPSVEFILSDSVCRSSSITLEARTTNGLPVDTFSYVWSDAALGTGSTVVVSTTTPGNSTYKVTVTSKRTGCTGEFEKQIVVHELPVVSLQYNGKPIEVTAVEINPCEGEAPLTLEVTSKFDKYLWIDQKTSGVMGEEQQYVIDDLTTLDTLSYTIRITDSCGCVNSRALDIIPLDTVHSSDDTTLCVDGTGTVTFLGKEYAYVDKDTVYEDVATFTSVNGCDSIVTYSIRVSKKVEITLTDNQGGSPYCHDEALNVEVNTNNFHSTIVEEGWMYADDNTPFDPTKLGYVDSGRKVYYYAKNACERSESEPVTLLIDSMPSFEPLTNSKVCSGAGFFADPVVKPHTSLGVTTKWEISELMASGYSDLKNTENFTYSERNHWFRFSAENHCGTSVSVAQVVVDTVVIATLSDNNNICANVQGEIRRTDLGFNSVNYDFMPPTSEKCVIDGTEYDFPVTNLSTLVGNHSVYYKFENGCNGNSQTNTVKLNISDKPEVAHIGSLVDCDTGFKVSTPAIDTNNSPLTEVGWQLAENETGPFADMDSAAIFNVDNFDKYVRYHAKNDCGDGYSDTVKLEVSSKPEIDDSDVKDIELCALEKIAEDYPEHPQVEKNHGANYEEYFEISATTGGAWTKLENGADIQKAWDKYNIRFIAKNDCGSDTSETKKLTVDSNFVRILSANDVVCAADGASFTVISNKFKKDDEGNPEVVILPESINAVLSVTSHSGDENQETYVFKYDTKNLTDSVTVRITFSSVKNECDAVDTTAVLHVNGTPKVDLAVPYTDTVCAGAAFVLDGEDNRPEQKDLDYNSFVPANDTMIYERYDNDATTPAWEAFGAVPTEFTSDMDGDSIRIKVMNGCDSGYSSAVLLQVSGSMTVAQPDVVDMCEDSLLKDFVPVYPKVTPETKSTVATDTIWQVYKEGDGWAAADYDNTVIKDQDSVRWYVKTKCDSFFSPAAKLTIDKRPEFTSTDLKPEVCHGSKVEFDGIAISYNDNGSDVIDTTWVIKATSTDDIIVDNNTVMDTSWNGKPLLCIIENHCGKDTLTGTITVHALPATEITFGDTSICNGQTLDLAVKDSKTTSTYAWTIDGTSVSGGSNTFSLPDGVNLANETVVVTETDEHGCKNTDKSIVRVSDLPELSFEVDGEARDSIMTTTDAPGTEYTVRVNNNCTPGNTHVYFEIMMYHDGELMVKGSSVNSPDSCIRTGEVSVNGESHHWYIQNDVSYTEYADAEGNVLSSYYYSDVPGAIGVSGGFHYPDGEFLGSGSNNKFDWFNLHYLITKNQGINTTVSQFLKPGTYMFVYNLYSSEGDDTNEHSYFNGDTSSALGLGGKGFTQGVKLISDTMTIVVTGPVVAAVSPAAAPAIAPAADSDGSATMSLYPNPADESVYINIDGLSGNSVITISDLSGKVLSRKELTIPAGVGYHHKQMIGSYAPGIYLVTVKNEFATITRKLVITR